MDEQEKVERHSSIFRGYVELVPNRDVNGIPIYSHDGYKFLVNLISMEKA